ncbi:MmcQ/YjbR family DNA-binding protein [Tumebacillus sp. DT12]|uniref:MmcQ/YjbR family DNA-binding protein n=1 Tax=Tumebacillus lacus TaxID=2995335 RepID=A0ABT3X012_9BACL|nr:MmcQ/YjbR family DNA-binding protein [Tumebacillus lacus]MCX7570245.1 MmcQ/YjbR family DNA-binding protein [Tumebacillus lacus]
MLAKVREICMRLPEVAEAVDKFGHTSFRVKDKPFVIMGEQENEGESGLSLAIKTLPTTQELLLQQEGYFKTPYIGQHGWTSLVTAGEPDWAEVEGYLYEAYLRTAPKSLAKLVK